MNTINVISNLDLNCGVNIVNGKYENHTEDSKYAMATINNRTYNYIQSLRINYNDSLYIYEANQLRLWGLDNVLHWLQDSDLDDLFKKLDWFVAQCEGDIFNITKSNHLEEERVFCEYSEQLTYSYIWGLFNYENVDNGSPNRIEYDFISVDSLSDFWRDSHNDNYYHNNMSSFELQNGNLISMDSYEDDYCTCYECDDVLNLDYANWTDDECYCDSCYHDINHCELDDWNHKPSTLNVMQLNHKKQLTIEPLSAKNESIEKFGIELECEFNISDDTERSKIVRNIRNINNGDSFYCVSDGSLNDGVEIVSHPMTFQAIKKFDWNKVLGYRGRLLSNKTSTCGIHIHINRDSMSVMEQYKFVQFINEQSTFGFYLSQRKVNDLNSWASFKSELGDELKRQLLYQYKDDLQSNQIRYSRYKNIILGEKYYATNLLHSKTIEVRIFKGTLNQRSFLKNVEYVKSVADWVKKSDSKNYLDFKAYWEYVQNSDKYSNLYNWCMDSEKMRKAIAFPKTRVMNLNKR